MEKTDQVYFDCEEKEEQVDDAFKSTHAKVYNRRLLIAMVGLPARGKTFISRKVVRYLTWLGYNAKVFNIGDKRRKILGVEDTSQSNFFDPKNKEAVRLREQLADDTLTDIVKFLNHGTGNIALFDGTNTTKKRRRKVMRVVDTYLPETDFFFLEIICNDQEQIERNLLRTKIYSPDFKGWNKDEIIKDFRDRIAKYESAYEEVGLSSADVSSWSKELDKKDPENSVPYIKIINTNERVISQNIQGFLNLQIVTFLLHLHLVERPLYLLRHGESEFILEDRIGGNPSITKDGVKFSKLLDKFFEKEMENFPNDKMTVYTSTLKRTIQTAQSLKEEGDKYDIQKPLKLLDEIYAGICDSLTYAEVKERYPEVSQMRDHDKMGFRYPKGESYYDVINRLQPFIVELERIKTPTAVIAHNAVLRCLYGYFAVLKLDSICHIDIPLHCVIKITPQTYGYHEEIFAFDIETGDITPYKTLDEMHEADVRTKDKHLDYIRKSKQKLSFDDVDINTPKKGFPSMTDMVKRTLSCNSIDKMAIRSISDEMTSEEMDLKLEMKRKAKTKAGGLKRTKKADFDFGNASDV